MFRWDNGNWTFIRIICTVDVHNVLMRRLGCASKQVSMKGKIYRSSAQVRMLRYCSTTIYSRRHSRAHMQYIHGDPCNVCITAVVKTTKQYRLRRAVEEGNASSCSPTPSGRRRLTFGVRVPVCVWAFGLSLWHNEVRARVKQVPFHEQKRVQHRRPRRQSSD